MNLDNKNGINVLSLFDGISCGKIALERAEIKVNNYFASEIDKYATIISNNNYPDIIRLGDVTKWKEWNIPKIDLLIGGSPCQGFSTMGNMLNFKHPGSRLFFQYVDVLNELKIHNSEIKFLLENVITSKKHVAIISKILGVEEIMLDSSLVSAQSRKRLYWTNICDISIPKDKKIRLIDILDEKKNVLSVKSGQIRPFPRNYKKLGMKRITRMEYRKDNKSNCLSTSNDNFVNIDGTIRKLTCSEWEKLQTLPEGYTKGVSNTQRKKAIGNGWTVDVISHIFRCYLKSE